MARILVADDHDAVREGMILSLTRLGHEVQGVRGGAEALAAYRKRPADVVVTDLRMLPVDGIEVVRRLREADPEATVLVVSAHGTIPVAVEALREGAIDFIEKPFSPEVLRARVEKAIEIEPNYASGRYTLGSIYAMSGGFGRAAREFEVALRIEPGNPDFRSALELCRRRRERSDKALVNIAILPHDIELRVVSTPGDS